MDHEDASTTGSRNGRQMDSGILDQCPDDANKTEPGRCGCGVDENCSGLISALVHRYRFEGSGTTLIDSKSGADGSSNSPLTAAGSLTLQGTSDSYGTLPAGILGSLDAATIEFWVTWQGGAVRQAVMSFGTAQPAQPSSMCAAAEFWSGAWYQFCMGDGTTSWWKARGVCEGATAELVAIESAAEQRFITSNPAFTDSVWMAANDLQTEGQWYFANARGLQGGTHFWSGDQRGSAVNGAYQAWQTNQPDGSDADADCSFIYKSGAWTAYRCDYNGNFTCQWRGHQGSAMARGISFTPAGTNSKPTLYLQFGTRAVAIQSTQAFPSHTEIQVAVVLDPATGSAALYIDGTLAASAMITGKLSDLRDADDWLGRSHLMSDPGFAGSISELRVYNRALGAEEIATSHAAGPDPPFLE